VNQLQQAERALQSSQQRLQESAADARSTIRILRLRVLNLAMQAELAARRKDRIAERESWEKIVALMNEPGDRLDGTSAICLLKAWRNLGRIDDADRLSARLHASGYRDEAITLQNGVFPTPRSLTTIGSRE
jgi:hypothetical protein